MPNSSLHATYQKIYIPKNIIEEVADFLNTHYTDTVLIFIGDVNLHVKQECEQNSGDYETSLSFNDLFSLIDGYTREEIRENKVVKSCIGHIYLRQITFNNKAMSGIIKTKLSDHYPIVLGISYSKIDQPTKSKIFNDKKLKYRL